MNNYPIIETVGIEFETTHIPLEKDIYLSGFNRTHDASIESDIYRIDRIYFNCDDKRILKTIKRNTTRLGTEFIMIPVYDKGLLKNMIYGLTDRLSAMGETEKGERESIHVHVGMSYNLDILKNCILLADIVESLLFHLGGMGYEYRGLKNESIFARPFNTFGPPIVRHRGKRTKLLIKDNLLKSETIDEFWTNYGGISTNHDNKYHPSRYFFINLMSLLLHGTLEYRVFNKCLNPDRILAVIEFCRELTRLTLNNDLMYNIRNKIEVCSIFEDISKNQNHNVLDSLPIELNLNARKELHTILELTPSFKFPKQYVFTHLINYLQMDSKVFPTGTGYKPTYLDESEFIATPNILDIHRLRERYLRNNIMPNLDGMPNIEINNNQVVPQQFVFVNGGHNNPPLRDFVINDNNVNRLHGIEDLPENEPPQEEILDNEEINRRLIELENNNDVQGQL